MLKNLKAESQAILRHVAENPEATMRSIVTATGFSPQLVSASLSTLYTGRYLKRTKSNEKSTHGQYLLAYTLKTLNPRNKKRQYNGEAKVETVDTPGHKIFKPKKQDSEVELMIAVKGTKETTVLTVKQARDLMEQLKQLGM